MVTVLFVFPHPAPRTASFQKLESRHPTFVNSAKRNRDIAPGLSRRMASCIRNVRVTIC